MKGLLNKEPYYYKIHTSLKKSCAYPPPPFYRHPLVCDTPFYDFSKISTPI